MQLPLVPYYETCDEDGPCAPYFTGHITDADGRVMCRTDSEERAIELVDCVDGLSANIEALRARLANWQDDINAVLKQRDDIHARAARLEEALKIIADGYIRKPICPHMNGTIEYSNHLMNRAMMMGLASATLRGEE